MDNRGNSGWTWKVQSDHHGTSEPHTAFENTSNSVVYTRAGRNVTLKRRSFGIRRPFAHTTCKIMVVWLYTTLLKGTTEPPGRIG